MDDHQFRLAPAADDRHHPLAGLGSGRAAPLPTTSPANSMPGMSAGDAGRRRVMARALADVGAVQAGGVDADQHLVRARLGVRPLLDNEPTVSDDDARIAE